MKKTKYAVMFLVVFFLLIILCGCSESYHIDGIENYHVDATNFELNRCLLPSEGFLECYDYLDINYSFDYFYESFLTYEGTEKTLITIQYEADEYERAKQFCLEHMELNENNVIECGGYVFIENIELKNGQEQFSQCSEFPHWFNMFAYNDEENTLAFIGFWSAYYSVDDASEIVEDWDNFIMQYFPVLDQVNK